MLTLWQCSCLGERVSAYKVLYDLASGYLCIPSLVTLFLYQCQLNEIDFLQHLDLSSRRFAISNWGVLPRDVGTIASLRTSSLLRCPLIQESPLTPLSSFITCCSLTTFYFPLYSTYLPDIKHNSHVLIASFSHILFTKCSIISLNVWCMGDT